MPYAYLAAACMGLTSLRSGIQGIPPRRRAGTAHFVHLPCQRGSAPLDSPAALRSDIFRPVIYLPPVGKGNYVSLRSHIPHSGIWITTLPRHPFLRSGCPGLAAPRKADAFLPPPPRSMSLLLGCHL